MADWSLSSLIRNFVSAAAGDVVRFVEADLRKRAEEVVEKARRLCIANSVTATTNTPHCSTRLERTKNELVHIAIL
jgi:hypothetical protein